MTEAEWLSSDDPQRMLTHLTGNYPHRVTAGRYIATDRKLRLFACACIEFCDPGSDPYTDYLEDSGIPNIGSNQWAENWARNDRPECHKTAAKRAALLRDIFGNPWKPVKSPWVQVPVGETAYTLPQVRVSWLAGLEGSNVLGIARGIYSDRNFSAMLVLHDALIDAGCNDEKILAHCLEPLHVRGCFLIDILLGKP